MSQHLFIEKLLKINSLRWFIWILKNNRVLNWAPNSKILLFMLKAQNDYSLPMCDTNK